MILASTHPLTKMSIRELLWGVKVVGVWDDTLRSSCADSVRHLRALGAYLGLYRDTFNLPVYKTEEVK